MTSGPGSTSGSKLPQLLVGVLLLGIADPMIGPYLVLFGAGEAQLSPFQVGVFMSVIAVSGLAVSAWLGAADDVPRRRHGGVPAVVHVDARAGPSSHGPSADQREDPPACRCTTVSLHGAAR